MAMRYCGNGNVVMELWLYGHGKVVMVIPVQRGEVEKEGQVVPRWKIEIVK